jgi:hypothetical protein
VTPPSMSTSLPVMNPPSGPKERGHGRDLVRGATGDNSRVAVNHIKMPIRQMFGRASLPLLRKRVLLTASR